MTDKAERYIFAKFGEEDINLGVCLPPDFQNHTLKDILEEFERLVLAKNIRLSQNPRTDNYTLVDKDKGTIIGSFKFPISAEINIEKFKNDAKNEKTSN